MRNKSVILFAMLVMTMLCVSTYSCAHEKPGVKVWAERVKKLRVAIERMDDTFALHSDDECKLLEKLADDEAIVECGGVKLRGITADHAREIEERKARLEAADKKVELLEQTVAAKDREVALQKEIADLQKEKASRYQEEAATFESEFTAEHSLRLEAEKLRSVRRGFLSRLFHFIW